MSKTDSLWSYKNIFKQFEQKNVCKRFFHHCQKKFSGLKISNLLSKLFFAEIITSSNSISAPFLNQKCMGILSTYNFCAKFSF